MLTQAPLVYQKGLTEQTTLSAFLQKLTICFTIWCKVHFKRLSSPRQVLKEKHAPAVTESRRENSRWTHPWHPALRKPSLQAGPEGPASTGDTLCSSTFCRQLTGKISQAISWIMTSICYTICLRIFLIHFLFW